MSWRKIDTHSSRRKFLAFLLAGGAAGLSPSLVLRYAYGLGLRALPSGIYRAQVKVQVNGSEASPGSPVNSGDLVSTAAALLAIFVAGAGVFLLRENSRLHLAPAANGSLNAKVAEVLRITAGQLLAVFGRGEKRFELPTATVGIRGTGIYAEPGGRRSY